MNKSILLVIVFGLNIQQVWACEQVDPYTYLQEKASQTKVLQTEYRNYIEALPLSSFPSRNIYNEISALYDDCFVQSVEKDSFKQMDSSQLQASYMVLYEAYFLTLKRSIVEKAYWLLLEQQERGISIKEPAEKIFNLAVQARDIDYAEKIASSFSLSLVVPDLEQADDENVFVTRGDSGTFSSKRFDFGERDLIVVSAPFCGPSKRFAQWYQTQGRLGVLKNINVFFLSPQEVPLGEHKEIYHELNYGIAYENDFWPDISSWNTPAFYYFEDGQLINAIDGWAHTDSEQKITQLVNK